MDAVDTNVPSMDLPPVVADSPREVEQSPQPVTVQGTERNPELLPPMAPPAQLPIPNNSAQPTLPLPITDGQQAGAQSAQVPTSDGSSVPLIADDADVIEKEWVDKAKAIVEQTKTDPYQQNKGINRVKADYIKTRYNKDIKLAEE